MNTNTESQNDTIDGQITVVETDKAMATLDPAKYAAVAFEPFKAKLAAAKRAAKKAEYNIATKEGMKQAKELRASFRDIRTGIESARKEAKGPILEAGKKVDAVAKELTDEVAPHEDKYAAEIAAEEARIEEEKQRKLAEERARIEAIEQRIAHIRNIPQSLVAVDSATISARLEELTGKRLEPAMYDEHLESAVNALNATIDKLGNMITEAMEREAEAKRIAEERAELARLKAEQEAREKAEREAEAERQRQMAEMRAQQEASAAALKRQQDQMTAIMEIQGLAAALQAAGEDRNPDAIEAALKKALTFNPEDFGPMTAMARMARDAAIPLLESLMDAVPVPEVPEVEPVHYSAPEESARGVRIIGIDLSPEGDAAVVTDIPVLQEPMRVEPQPVKPTDDELIELVMRTYGESRKTVLDWLAEINYVAAYEKLAEQA